LTRGVPAGSTDGSTAGLIAAIRAMRTTQG